MAADMAQDKAIGPLLKVDDLHVDFTVDGKIIHAVRGVSFHIDQGETVALVGEFWFRQIGHRPVGAETVALSAGAPSPRLDPV